MLNSCLLFNENGIRVEVKNRSNEPITDVIFTTSEQVDTINFKQIKANRSVNDFLSMRNNTHDGTYLLSFTRANGKRERCANGYYTNGGALNYSVVFLVKNDTVIVNYDEIVY